MAPPAPSCSMGFWTAQTCAVTSTHVDDARVDVTALPHVLTWPASLSVRIPAARTDAAGMGVYKGGYTPPTALSPVRSYRGSVMLPSVCMPDHYLWSKFSLCDTVSSWQLVTLWILHWPFIVFPLLYLENISALDRSFLQPSVKFFHQFFHSFMMPSPPIWYYLPVYFYVPGNIS